eukprot:scaffold2077_cov233-Chaetoceros_neogracile.AAC.2
MSRADAFTYLSNGPFCLVALDRITGKAIQTNETFNKIIGPFFKFASYEFSSVATLGESRTKFSKAIEMALSFSSTTVSSTSSTAIAGSDTDVEARSKDAELIDFFQNAPIALHWLSGEGIVLWANQTELDVLGYTAEEYIGQPIMKFCPDEEELVLEIFKQLGSGNSIRDVPVRFRTKDGRIVDLLIDSNVKYDSQTKDFSHTRCFIRDDTQRKIREAHAQTVLEEIKHSLQLLDKFMSRSIHHMRTPLHMMQNTCELVTDILMTQSLTTTDGTPTTDGTTATNKAAAISPGIQEGIALLKEAASNIGSAVGLTDDLIQLSRLDQGAELQLKPTVIDLVTMGEDVYAAASKLCNKKVEFALELQGGSGTLPRHISSDLPVLHRIFRALLEHTMNVTHQGVVKFQIGYEHDRCTFTIAHSTDTSTDNHTSEETTPSSNTTETSRGAPGILPPIFQRYQQEFIPDNLVDCEQAVCLRSKIELGVNSCKDNNVGIGLSLAYFLVQALGSELRYSPSAGLSRFWFSLPKQVESSSNECDVLPSLTRVKSYTSEERSTNSNESLFGKNLPGAKFKEQPTGYKAQVPMENSALHGLKSMDPPHVLIVEDTAMCAKLLRMTLSKFNCSSTCVENGQLAVDLLRQSPLDTFQLCLMDLRMPIMDGLEATRIVKTELVHLSVPIIAMTAETGESIQADCAEIGFDGFLSKPLKRVALKEALREYTGYCCALAQNEPSLYGSNPSSNVVDFHESVLNQHRNKRHKHIPDSKEESLPHTPVAPPEICASISSPPA